MKSFMHAVPRRRPNFQLRCIALATALAIAGPQPTLAQQQPAPAPPPVTPPPAASPAPAQQQFQPSGEWAKLPRMQLERQFAGPLLDTVVQRWRDPVDGTVCYIYLPISVAHTPTTATGFVQYGANTIGSINCIAASPAKPAAPPAGRK